MTLYCEFFFFFQSQDLYGKKTLTPFIKQLSIPNLISHLHTRVHAQRVFCLFFKEKNKQKQPISDFFSPIKFCLRSIRLFVLFCDFGSYPRWGLQATTTTFLCVVLGLCSAGDWTRLPDMRHVHRPFRISSLPHHFDSMKHRPNWDDNHKTVSYHHLCKFRVFSFWDIYDLRMQPYYPPVNLWYLTVNFSKS